MTQTQLKTARCLAAISAGSVLLQANGSCTQVAADAVSGLSIAIANEYISNSIDVALGLDPNENAGLGDLFLAGLLR